MKATLIQCLHEGGKLLRKRFGKINAVTLKGSHSDVVTEADLASEKLISRIIRKQHPTHNLLGEEGGIERRGSNVTWVIDPLDGTSNFAAGLPWFGVMIGVLEDRRPVMGGMYLPLTDTLYFAERGKGAFRNGKRLQLPKQTRLADTLCTYGLDGGVDDTAMQQQAELLMLLVKHARNVRLTNSLVDFCNTLDGHIGACVNQNCKIWDIVPASLIFPEAGGRFTDLQGKQIKFDLDPATYQRSYAVMGGNPTLHRQVLALARKAGFHR
jgi:myo-inositol-1(or 4)-monophosphatase